jgi:hypothetical protein
VTAAEPLAAIEQIVRAMAHLPVRDVDHLGREH